MREMHFALILAAVILASGCTGQQAQGNTTGSSGGANQPQGTAQSGSGTKTVDVTACVANCASIGSLADACRIGCYLDDAKAAKDPARCDPIKGIENATLFYSTCLGDVSGELGNVGPCDRARNESEKDWCIISASDTLTDPSICEGVNDSMMKSICIDDTNKSK